jgi:adenine-specific DNA-methyltransferase
MNKQDLIQKLKTLDGLSADEKSALINLVNTRKKYGLVWEDKIEDVEEELRVKLPVLKEVKEKAIISQEVDAPNHILIEGDNLHALTALTFTHEGKIDVIFIDPPYNTGNKDFKYNDTFVDKEDSYRHSKWLSFMHKRLEIAKRLLSETGIIFISIDDNEQSALKLMCDEIFSESLFVANFLWKKKGTSTNVEGAQVSSLTDYVLCYKKSISAKLTPRVTFAETRKYPNRDFEGNFRTTIIEKKNSGGYRRETMLFPILGQIPREGKRWQIGEKTARVLEKKNRFIIDEGTIKLKIYDFEDEDTSSAHPNILENFGSSDSASKMVNNEILGVAEKFNNPKPIDLLSFLIEISSIRKDTTVLDFFAGSGSTLHAVMNLNQKDNGSRNCILVTNNENNICEEVTYLRASKVIKGYSFFGKKREKLFNKNITLNMLKNSDEVFEKIDDIKAKSHANWESFKTEIKNGEILFWGEASDKQSVFGFSNNNLRYYKSEYVSRETSLKNKRQLTLLATELLSIKEDCYHDITAEFSSAKWIKLFNNAKGKWVCVIYDDVEIETGIAIIQQVLAKYKPTQKIKVYVFSNGQYPYTEDFEDILENIELCALPDAIYKAYQNVLPKRKRTEVPEIEDPTAEEVETATDLFNQNSEN